MLIFVLGSVNMARESATIRKSEQDSFKHSQIFFTLTFSEALLLNEKSVKVNHKPRKTAHILTRYKNIE